MLEETTVATTDEHDLAILGALVSDGRASHREITRRTGMSLATVNRRVRKMEETQVLLGATVRVNPEAVGWGLTALVGVRIDKGHLREVQKQVAKDPRVFAVYDVTGEWDGFVLARLRNRADLDDFAKTTMSVPHIQRTNTMVVLSTAKEEAIVRLPEPA
jgi:DNA-binding Lrp family transcriptional regulator